MSHAIFYDDLTDYSGFGIVPDSITSILRDAFLNLKACLTEKGLLTPITFSAIRSNLEMDSPVSNNEISLKELRSNKASAWEAAYQRLWKVAWLSAKKKLYYDSNEQIEDLVAQVISKEVVPQILNPTQTVFVKAKSFEDIINIVAKVIGNRAIDEIRRRTRLPGESVIDSVSESEFVKGDEEQKKEISDDIHSAIDGMETRYKEVIEDFYFEGLKTDEISRKRGRPKGTICTDLVKAREMLGELLKRNNNVAFS